jgi:hypothetical protein
MAEAKIELQIDVDGAARAKAQIKSVERSVDKLERRINKIGSGFASSTGGAGGAGGAGGSVTKTLVKWKRSFDQFDKAIKMVGTIGLKGLSLSLKGATIEMAAMGAAMLGVHAAFLLGNGAMKLMKSTLGPLAAGMAAVVAAAAAASAAIREQQAAMFAYKTTSKGQFGSSLNQTRQVMRGLHADVDLASVGVENLNAAFATISKTSTFTGKSQGLLKGLMDFASAGQPIEEGIKKAADLIALLQDSKKSFSEAKTSAQQLFPDKKAVDKAFKDLKINNKKSLEAAITSGELAKAAGLEGQFEAVSGTLISKLKGYFNLLKVQFGDMGQPLLEPIKKSMFEIFNILSRGFAKISGSTQRFGMTSMLDGLVSMVQKLTDLSVNLINENLGTVTGMFERMASWWKEFKYGWNETLDKLRPFIDGARVIESMFGAIWVHVKNIAASSFGQFNDWLVNNKATVIEFGDRIGELIGEIMKFQTEMKKLLQDLMPFINDVVKGISAMVSQMTSFMKGMRSLSGGGTIGALAMLLGVRTGLNAMKNTKGGMVASAVTKNATINAPNATIVTSGTPGGGRVVTGPPAGGMGGTHALPPGAIPPTYPPITYPPGVIPGQRPGMYYGTGGNFASNTGGPMGPGVIPGMYYGTGGNFAQTTGGPMGPGGRPAFGNALGPSALGRISVPGRPGPSSPIYSVVPSGTYDNLDPDGNPIYNRRGYKVRDSRIKNDRLRRMSDKYRQKSYDMFTADADDPDGDKLAAEKANRRVKSGRRQGQFTTSSKLRQRAMANRAARSGPRQSKGMKRFGKFQGSGGAKMGTSLALGAMSQFAPEEAQGALALGGAVGAMNPLAGIAVAGLGTAYKAKTATGGAVSGLAGGAAAGALIGSFVPVIGTAAGAIIGGLIGAVSGGIMGTLNKKKEEVKKSKAAAGEVANSIINNSFSFALDATRRETGVGRSATRDILKTASKYQKNLLADTAGVPLNRKNYAGIVPDVMNRGATGGQLGLAFESATGKRMPKLIRKYVGSATTSLDIAGNISAGIISKLGGKSLLDNRVLNPLGFGTNNKKDVDRQKQESKLTEIYRNQSKYGVSYSKTQYEDMMKKPGEALRKMRTDMEVSEAAMAPLQKNYNSRLDALAKITGKSDQENIALAKTMGVNLMDSTKDFNEVLKELGLTTVKTAQQLRAATTSVLIDATSLFDEANKSIRAPEIIDERSESFRELAAGGGGKTSLEAQNTFLSDQLKNYTAYFGDGVKALAQYRLDYEQGGIFDEGRTFQYLDPNKIGFDKNETSKKLIDTVTTQFGNDLGTQLNKALLGPDGTGKSIDTAEFTKRFKAMTPQQQVALSDAANAEFKLPSGAAGKNLIDAAGGDSTKALLDMIGMSGLVTTTASKQETIDTTKLPEAIGKKTTELIEKMKVFFEDTDKATPAWYDTAPSWWADHDDTTTPRGQAFGDTTSSRLSQTMGRHASMDSALTGKRTVTSGYRNYGLGSINSDHVTGRAYDIVGQNLGQYQSLVKSTGGFAEFHGVNKARHLHVVPGSGAMGDTGMPVAGLPQQPLVTSSAGRGNEYNFYVTGNQNASAKEIADMVMQKVKEIERSNSERR